MDAEEHKKKDASTEEVSGEEKQQNCVGKCQYCDVQYDNFTGDRVCTVCRELALVCEGCKSKLNGEFHCMDHMHLRNCYFTNLGRFSKEELQIQLQELETKLDDIAVGKRYKQKRQTLHKQCERIQDILNSSQDELETMNDASSGCRSCGDQLCNGECWGVHGLKRKNQLEKKMKKKIPKAPRLSANKRPSKIVQRQKEIDDIKRLKLSEAPNVHRNNDTSLRCPPPCIRILSSSVKGKWCGRTIKSVLSSEFHEFSDPTRLDELFRHSLVQIDGVPVNSEEEDNGDDDYAQSNGRSRHSSSQSDLQNVPESGTDMNFIGNAKNRPRRLPPLIEELVGTLDGDYIGAGVGIHTRQKQQQGQNQQQIIRRVKKDSHSSNNNQQDRLEKMTKQGLEKISNGDDSVAMVAAAAAAAVLSENETTSKRGQMRMKTVNSEWEEALRWISSWGQTQTTQSHTTNHAKGKKHSQDASTASRKERRKRDSNRSSHNSHHPAERFSADNEIDFELFLEVCINRCIGGISSNSNDEGNNSAIMDSSTTKLNVRTTALGVTNRFLSSFKSILHNMKAKSNQGWMGHIHKSRNREQVLQSLFGVLISTATLWLVRNAIDWRKTNKYTKTLHSLLEDERREAIANPILNDTGKGSAKKSKKARRKQRRSQPKDRKSMTPTRTETQNDIESEASEEDFFERRFLEVKHFDDHAGKECNTTVSTCTTDGADFEYQMMSTDATITKHKAINNRNLNKNNKHLNQTVKKRNNDGLGPKGSTPQHEQSHGGARRNNRQAQSSFHKYSPAKFQGKTHSPKHMHQQGEALSDYNIPMIPMPTAEQREESSRKLAEYQQMQIQKYLKLKQQQKETPTRDPAQSNPSQVSLPASNNISNNNVEAIRPPPGLTKVTQIESENFNQSINSIHTEEPNSEADAGYLLSLLDDEEEEDEPKCKSTPKQASPDRHSKEQVKVVRSIALGDLLVGSFSATPASNHTQPSLSFSSNPWAKDESDSTVETCNSSPTHSTSYMTHNTMNNNINNTSLSSFANDLSCSNDANVCLQVSAVAFSPSTESNGPKIW